ncbi:hypothetical protein [Thermoflexibacter ruber]|uniref:DUF3575 domain-containing protein n=1 Tax=Thermoflexibacter ruber TaxID=1003 RepID=A0A1I2JZR5_9BACT|nr:hypothetical protein [Thermoflexibacter ruber]SFF59643.1 hypothetical protein SAMN04488541_10746 [Thermoflexibacter ruber]
MKNLILLVCVFAFHFTKAQTKSDITPSANVRLSFLIFPFTPLLTVEVRTIGNLTLQFESNFVNTHGANLKYFINNRMDGHYVFMGIALVDNKLLREDGKTTFLPYAGYGYAHRFGHRRQWTFDSRIGIGPTTNADNNSIYPVIKTGVGYLF